MGRCRITVLRRTYYADLVEQFGKNPELGPCDWFSEGAVYYTGGKRVRGFVGIEVLAKTPFLKW